MNLTVKTLLIYSLIVLLGLGDFTMFWGSTWYYESGYKMSTPHGTQANFMYFLAGVVLLLFVLHKFPSFKHFKQNYRICVFLMSASSLIWAFSSYRSGESLFALFIRQYAPLMFLGNTAQSTGKE